MADIDITGAANWSTCKTGSIPPAADDTVFLNTGGTLTLDGTSATYTCVAIKQATSAAPTTYNQTGIIAMAAGGDAAPTIAANLIAGAADMITLAAGANKTLTITGTVTGGSTASKRGIYVSGGTHVLNVTACVGGAANSAHGIKVDGGTVTGTIETATGSATAAAYGAYCNSSLMSNTITNAVGGAYEGAYGVQLQNGTLAITNSTGSSAAASSGILVGSGTHTITNATGGGVTGSYGVLASGGTTTITTAKGGTVTGALGAGGTSGTLIINGTNLTGTGYPVGTHGATVKVAAGVKLQFSNASAALTKYYDPTLMPAVGAVLLNTSYGGGDYLGTLAGVRRGGALRGA